MKIYIRNNLGLILFCCYALLIVLVGFMFGEMFLFWLPWVTILLIGVFDPLNNLSWSVKAFIKRGV